MCKKNGEGFINTIKKGVAVLMDSSGYYNQFLYDFKKIKKLSADNHSFQLTLNNDEYLVFTTGKFDENTLKFGIMKYDGTIIKEAIYDDIGYARSEMIYEKKYTSIVPMKKDNKYGFYNFKTNKDVTGLIYDKLGSATNSFPFEPDNEADSTWNVKNNLAYVITGNKGYIINTTNGNVIKNMDSDYDYVYPINTDMLLTVRNKKIDIVDYSLKSIINKTFEYTKGYFVSYYDSKIDLCLDNSSLVCKEPHTFNYETKTLEK